jgi:hypothetical protein
MWIEARMIEVSKHSKRKYKKPAVLTWVMSIDKIKYKVVAFQEIIKVNIVNQFN